MKLQESKLIQKNVTKFCKIKVNETSGKTIINIINLLKLNIRINKINKKQIKFNKKKIRETK